MKKIITLSLVLMSMRTMPASAQILSPLTVEEENDSVLLANEDKECNQQARGRSLTAVSAQQRSLPAFSIRNVRLCHATSISATNASIMSIKTLSCRLIHQM